MASFDSSKREEAQNGVRQRGQTGLLNGDRTAALHNGLEKTHDFTVKKGNHERGSLRKSDSRARKVQDQR